MSQRDSHQRRSPRLQRKEEEKRRINLRDLLKRGNSKSKLTSTIEKDGDFSFKRSSSSQPVSDVAPRSQRQSSSQPPSSAPKVRRHLNGNDKNSTKIRKLTKEDIITPDKTKKTRGKKNSHTNYDQYEEHSASFQLALPVDDTPIIRRNKEMRKGSTRRSSLTNRGKRVSSIGNGFSAIPHDRIPTNEFYKHIDQSLPDPHKMRQLLTWCSKRMIDEDKNRHIKKKNRLSNEELTALNIAKVIKEEIVKDLSDGKIKISWWNEGEDEKENSLKDNTERALLPNERNIKNLQALDDLKRRLENLKKDVEHWDKLSTQNLTSVPTFETDLQNLKVLSINKEERFKRAFDDSIVNEISQIEEQTYNEISESLENSLDIFNDFISKLKASSDIRERFTNMKSVQLSKTLDQTFDDPTIKSIKDNLVNQEVDTQQLLQAISRLDKQ
ncbi:hypothetical protein WICMUC_001542 [Wickerhamomyces mucosus]|uniref:Kinetochore protein mis13 n=1 Tax=Wickerhamomyces mucosus TaxID=1378264 RepID=A0A9P8PVU5_9ASCO|nr:hypothetical protein WICMUC_001542 [Wickerhamomyces mucosus]